jgi:adenylate cyclase class IV
MSLIESILASIIGSIAFTLLLAAFTPGSKALAIGNPIRRLLLRIIASKVGILQIYAKSSGLHRRIAAELTNSKDATFLQIRGQEFLTTGTNPILRDAFSRRVREGLHTRVLLLNPYSHHVVERAKDVSFNPKALKNGIKASLEELQSKSNEDNKLEIHLHNEKPSFCVYIFDSRLYLSFYVSKSRRQECPVLEVGAGSMLYHAFVEYCEWIWSTKSESLELWNDPLGSAQYHFEVEEKVKVLDRTALLDQLNLLGARFDRYVTYRDHYYDSKTCPELLAGGEETRIRCDLKEGKIYRTHKLPFNGPNRSSKRQLEKYVGSTHEFDRVARDLATEGFVEATRFWKHCSDYKLFLGGHDLQLTIAYISDNGTETSKQRSKEYLEVESLLPEDSSPREIQEVYGTILSCLQKVAGTVSDPTNETYVGIASKWPQS